MGRVIKLGDAEASRLMDYLKNEIEIADREVLKPLQEKRKAWDAQYYGEVEPRLYDWMSNFPVLMGATFTDAITARLLNTTFAYKPFYTVEPIANSEWTKVAKSIEDYMEFKIRTEMKMYREMRKTMFETTRLGTGALLTPWVRIEQETTTSILFWKRRSNIVYQNGIMAKYLPIRDLLTPGGYSELDELPWWGRRLRWSLKDIERLRLQKRYGYLDDVEKFIGQEDEDQREAREAAGEQPAQEPQVAIVWEMWLEYNLKKGGPFRRYVATVHLESDKVLRLEEDDYPSWPLQIFRYGPRDYGLYGLGVMEMSSPYDDALYGIYNTLVDNFKIATLQCFKGKKGVGLHDKTKIYPGKLFLMNDPNSDLMPFPMGTPFAIDAGFPRLIWDLGERRSGVSDYALGRESPIVGQRATATGTLALIQEGQRRFDLTIGDIRDCLDNHGMFHLRTMHKMLPMQEPYMVLGERGAWMQEFLKLPASDPYMALRLKAGISNVAMNKEVQKNDAQATFMLLGQYYQQMIQLSMLLAQPNIAATPLTEVIQRMMQASSTKLQRVLEAYGELSPEMYADVTSPLTQVPSEQLGQQMSGPGTQMQMMGMNPEGGTVGGAPQPRVGVQGGQGRQ